MHPYTRVQSELDRQDMYEVEISLIDDVDGDTDTYMQTACYRIRVNNHIAGYGNVILYSWMKSRTEIGYMTTSLWHYYIYIALLVLTGTEASSDGNSREKEGEYPVSIMPKLVARGWKWSQLRVIIFSTRTSNPYGLSFSQQSIDRYKWKDCAITYIGYNDIYVIEMNR